MAGNCASGRRRQSRQNRIEQHPALDVNQLGRAGALRPGSEVGCEWNNGAAAVLVAGESHLCVHYKVHHNGYGGGAPETQTITIACIPWRFGSSRRYFECDTCHRLVWTLYAIGGHFACRRCSGLVYSSQLEPPWIRAERRVKKLEAHLGNPAVSLQKPRGMWGSTYARLLEKAVKADEIAAEAFSRRIGKFLEWSDRGRSR